MVNQLIQENLVNPADGASISGGLVAGILSDADFVDSIPAITISQVVLADLAPQYGYSLSDTANYNNNFRNVVLSFFSGERLEMIYGHQGLDGVKHELDKLRVQGLI